MPDGKPDLEIRKEFAKIGMTASLSTAVVTAPFLRRNKTVKNIHTGAGVLSVAFALWHHFLYQPDKKKSPRISNQKP
ncbi:MAG: hypothetical protein CSB22_00480 [Deltaproteobacteria bacterium]|nr:MAG: hypothetical protein CSB22_00480 [Deltaproteobacteria bacterium]